MTPVHVAPVAELDFNDFIAGGSRQDEFVNQLRLSLSDTGFFYLRNHGVASEVIGRAFDSFPDFFVHLPLATRLQYEYPFAAHQRGYTPPELETGEYALVPDAKHFWHTREEYPVDVAEVRHFSDANRELFAAFKPVFGSLMEAVALSLGLDLEYFHDTVGNSLLRTIHYPAQENPETSDRRVEELTEGGNAVGMCAARHTDINFLTLLLALQPGLELWYNNQWMPMHLTDPNVFIVNCGDMLQHLTGGRYRSAQHRVVCEPGLERYSAPYFGHVVPEAFVVPLEVLGESDLTQFPHRTANGFLYKRLVDIGLLVPQTQMVVQLEGWDFPSLVKIVEDDKFMLEIGQGIARGSDRIEDALLRRGIFGEYKLVDGRNYAILDMPPIELSEFNMTLIDWIAGLLNHPVKEFDWSKEV